MLLGIGLKTPMIIILIGTIGGMLLHGKIGLFGQEISRQVIIIQEITAIIGQVVVHDKQCQDEEDNP